jgi:H+/Cl- antiporter ClcA
MNEWPSAIVVMIIAVMLVNLAVSIAVARSGYYSSAQVGWQLALVWLVPLLGAALAGSVLWSQRLASARTPGADPNQWQGGEHAAPAGQDVLH